jgi:hypothetical protein
MGVLGVSLGIVAVIVIAGIAFLGLLVIVIGPSRGVRAEPPLDPDVEAALLLGEDPDEISREHAAVTHPEPDSEFDGETDSGFHIEPVDGDPF